MRKRNIKVNFYLNENEKNILNEKHKKAKLSQSDFLRYLIINYQNKNLLEDNIEDIINSLSKVTQQINTIKEILNKF